MRVRARFRRGGATWVAGGVAVALLAAGCSHGSAETAIANPGCPRVSYAPSPARGSLIIGLNSVWNNACNLNAIRAAGVRMERLELSWPQVEPSPGHWRWAVYDKKIRTAARHGITILPLMMGSPSWAGPANSVAAPPSGFAEFVARAARRYGPGGSLWRARARARVPYHPATWFEIWNEPYLEQFSPGGPQPATYARLFKAAAVSGRNANPRTRYLIAADTSGLTVSKKPSPWVDPMYAAVPDLSRYIDGVAIHPYAARSPTIFTPGSESRFQFDRIQQLHQMFAAHGAANKPFWITEVGWSTCPGSPDACVSEADQAKYIAEVFAAVRGKYSQWVKALFLYNYRDSPAATDPTDKEHWFGLIRRNGSPKPAWNTLRAQ
ncbi:MAG TPA: hypothetical protein VF032_11485 [Thermoleophilaceae bacterium]